MFSRISNILRAKNGFFTNSILLLGILCFAPAQAITINVVGPDGVTPISGFRWVLEEDNTHAVVPGATGATDTLSFGFHASHAPTLDSGDSAGAATIPLAGSSTDRYAISVLPWDGSSMTGVSVNASQDAETVTLVVNANPIPTAQISVFAYEDNFPLNNMPDRPAAGTAPNFENGIAGMDVLLFDGGGLYGQAGGQVIQDAYGNPLGTTYLAGTDLVDVLGNGVLKTGPDGTLKIKNLVPAKYGIMIVPTPGTDWQQTHTIEGSKMIDAWVKPNEPSFFTEFGPPGHHVFIGFVSPSRLDNAARAGSSSLTGSIKSMHLSRPPAYSFSLGAEVGRCWVGLNPLPIGSGKAVYASKCNADGSFFIPGLRAGQNYQLVIWDEAKFTVIASQNVSIPPTGADVDLGDVGVFDWFGRLFSTVFLDFNQNGFMDAEDQPIPEQNTVIRFRNGQIYREMPTDLVGEAPQEEVFPFFHWLVAEVDFVRFKSTGMTYVVDNGGGTGGYIDADAEWSFPTFDISMPQPQCIGVDLLTATCDTNPNTGNDYSRTLVSADEGGPVLTYAFQQFLGQTSHVFWGKAPYQRFDVDLDGDGTLETVDENGGISGIVFYATTRAEEQPRFAAAEEWEPGIPRVQVNLYPDVNNDGVIDADIDPLTDLNTRTPVRADVDNHPIGWSEGGTMGIEDVDQNGNSVFDMGDAIQYTHTDSWDDSNPTGCQGAPYTYNGTTFDCYDGLRNFNQIRPAVFDGGYAFAGLDRDISGGLSAGDYLVEATIPPGYKLLKEEDKNVDFGETFTPTTNLVAAECAGDMHIVPQYLSFQTHDDGTGTPVLHVPAGEEIGAPYAGLERPLCDLKKVRLTARTNAAADFFLFTDTPKAARVVGFMLNDLANEFDPNAPTFGEKLAPSWLPVSIKDWTGREIVRTYSDQFGKYNALLPSTFTMNAAMPSGAGPVMLTACMNDAGQQLNINTGQYETDPMFNRQFTQFCYTFQYMPGSTTYLDTPVLPIAAFAANGSNPVDCECLNGTPKIYEASAPSNAGPIFDKDAGGSVTVTSLGFGSLVDVPNPAYNTAGPDTRKTISRDYGFGAVAGTAQLIVPEQDNPVDLAVTSWTNESVTFTVPSSTRTGQLVITRGDNGKSTESGITLHAIELNSIGTNQTTVRYVSPSLNAGATPIQDMINVAASGDLILIPPGTYNELVIMDKPVKLQGYGAGSVSINAMKVPGEKLQNWRSAIAAGYGAGDFDVLPGQADALALNRTDNEPGLFPASEGPGIIVLGKRNGNGTFGKEDAARIDGMSITGGDTGGAIFVNGYAHFLSVSNMRLVANQGTYGGGIRVGDPFVARTSGEDDKAFNRNIVVHHNEIIENGGMFGAGGGVSIYAGADNYQVSSNRICGNFSQGGGGGIGHLGNSRDGIIADNDIIFNQSFNQLLNVNGGGILISGSPVAAGLTEGSGDININGNLIQGNNAGAGDGAGIRLQFVNGTEVGRNVRRWYDIDVTNNVIVNNVAGYAGGGISLSDVLVANIVNNTIAHNDSTGTSESALAENSDPNVSNPHTAGIVSYAHSTGLNFAIPSRSSFDAYRGYARPTMVNNIIWENRAFNWSINGVLPNGAPDYGLNFIEFDDLGVIPAGIGTLVSTNSLITNTTDEPFVADYFNGDRGQTLIIREFTTNIRTAAAVDEGGNMIDIAYGPLTLDGGNSVTGTPANDGNPDGNYHLIGTASTAIDQGAVAIDGDSIFGLYPYTDTANDVTVLPLANDVDGDCRPDDEAPSLIDIGADENNPPVVCP